MLIRKANIFDFVYFFPSTYMLHLSDITKSPCVYPGNLDWLIQRKIKFIIVYTQNEEVTNIPLYYEEF